jgi:hypothetical protein
LTRKELIQVGDSLVAEIEEANLREEFPPSLGKAVQKYEFLAYFEGCTYPDFPPEDGGQAHARIMDAMGFIMNGEIVPEGHKGLNRELD